MARVRPYTPEELEARRARMKEYNSRPEVKARKQAYNNRPGGAAARAAYYRKPEVLAKYKARNGDEAHREYCKQWRSSPNGKIKLKVSGLKQSAFTLELWEQLRSIQGNACAVCRRPFTAEKNIHADHCHETQTPRGLLCHLCNMAEGMIKKTGLTPEQFGRLLSNYLAATPYSNINKTGDSPKENMRCF